MREAFGAEVKLMPGGNGIFDVIVDEKRVFSKHNSGRFPDPGEVVGILKQ